MTHQARVAIVTIWHNTGARLHRFAEDLRNTTYLSFRPIFVVYRLSEAEVEQLSTSVPNAIVVQPGRNLGAGAGWNRGAHEAVEFGCEYVWFLNVDVHPAPDCLARMVSALEPDSGAGACQPLLLHSDEPELVQMFGGTIDVRSGATWHDFAGVTRDKLPAVREAGYVDGGSALIRSSVLAAVGGFDERLFLYYEDVDMSLRIQAAGFTTLAVRDALAWHEHRALFRTDGLPYQTFYKTRNRLYVIGKHAGNNRKRHAATNMLLRSPLTTAYLLSRGRPDLVQAYFAGWLAGVRGRMGYAGWVT